LAAIKIESWLLNHRGSAGSAVQSDSMPYLYLQFYQAVVNRNLIILKGKAVIPHANNNVTVDAGTSIFYGRKLSKRMNPF